MIEGGPLPQDRYNRLGPGIYVDRHDATLHLDLVEMCVAHGYEPTTENQATLEREVAAVFAGTPLIEHADDGAGEWRK